MSEVIKLTLEDFQRLKHEYDSDQKRIEENKKDHKTWNKTKKIRNKNKKYRISLSSFF